MIAAIAEVFQFRPDWHRLDRAIPLVRQYDLKLAAVLEADPDLHDCLAHCCHCGIRFLTYRCNRGRRDLRCPFGCRQHHRRQLANARSRKHYQTPEGRKRKEGHNSRRSPDDQHQPPAHQELPTHEEATHEEATHEEATHDEATCDEATYEQPTLQREPPPRQVPPSASLVEQLSALHLRSRCTPSSEARSERLNQPSPENASSNDVALTETWVLELEGVTLTNVTLASSPVLSYLCQVVRLIEGRSITREKLLKTLGQSLRQRSLGTRARREYVLAYLNEHPPP